ncbi:MAG TPA: glycosyltransferase family 2 protein [Limnochordales bacterium]|nr:glycosyltransferase family 2 protein [Limnochordales bacterium]
MNAPTLVSAIIPAYNEAAILPATVAALRAVPGIHEVVVVDDGSTDETAALARGLGCRVVQLGRNRGKGAALAAGVAAAAGQVLLLLDADLGPSAREAGRLLSPILAGEADMVIGRLPPARGPGGFGLVKALAGAGIRWLTGLSLAAPLSGQRAVRREVLAALPGLAGGFGVEVGLTIDAARAGFRVVEVPVAMEHRETGRDMAGFWHRGRQLWHVAGALARRVGRPAGRR